MPTRRLHHKTSIERCRTAANDYFYDQSINHLAYKMSKVTSSYCFFVQPTVQNPKTRNWSSKSSHWSSWKQKVFDSFDWQHELTLCILLSSTASRWTLLVSADDPFSKHFSEHPESTASDWNTPVAPANEARRLILASSENKWAFVRVTVWMKSQRVVLARLQSLRHSPSTEQQQDLHLSLLCLLCSVSVRMDSCLLHYLSLRPELFSIHWEPWRDCDIMLALALAERLTWRYGEAELIPAVLCLLNMWGKEAIYFQTAII